MNMGIYFLALVMLVIRFLVPDKPPIVDSHLMST
jgi:hypothetical protein